jgi:hypothetical protein
VGRVVRGCTWFEAIGGFDLLSASNKKEVAMGNHANKLPPEDPFSRESRLRRIEKFWNALEETGDSGEASREALEEIRGQVTDCLMRNPQNLEKAESLTAKAALKIQGQESF